MGWHVWVLKKTIYRIQSEISNTCNYMLLLIAYSSISIYFSTKASGHVSNSVRTWELSTLKHPRQAGITHFRFGHGTDTSNVMYNKQKMNELQEYFYFRVDCFKNVRCYLFVLELHVLTVSFSAFVYIPV